MSIGKMFYIFFLFSMIDLLEYVFVAKICLIGSIADFYIREHHSKSYIKKFNKQSSFISRVTFLNYKDEIPKPLFIFNMYFCILIVVYPFLAVLTAYIEKPRVIFDFSAFNTAIAFACLVITKKLDNKRHKK